MATDERTYRVDLLTRVEGEGRFTLRVRDGVVESAELSIFEAPRFYEAFLRGRSMHEVSDVVARICGICPVAYQMSAAAALEDALGIAVPDEIGRLRRLLYCGEWIESHALHVFMLHAPDYLGYPSAIEMARDHRAIVERGLRLKKVGNRILEVLGGRATHPISPRIGGFSKAPTRSQLEALLPDLEQSLEIAEATVALVSGWSTPSLDVPYVFVALACDEYPLERGTGLLVGGPGAAQPTYRVDYHAWDEHFVESHVARSNALHCHLRDGGAYLTGPQARLFHHGDKLHPRARAALLSTGLGSVVTNPYRSIVVRAVELVHALAEAIDLVRSYRAPTRPFVEAAPRRAAGAGASEAPRGALFHRYAIAEDGTIEDAKIVPPTSQNQARIERDLVALGPELVTLPHDEATLRCEQLIRAYDPCISCATHFLRLDIERLGGARGDAEPAR
jgi:coenzyme F420-reducing hydrogenase alpha subunit